LADRPTDAEITALVRSYLSQPGIDPGDWWRGVSPEIFQHVFRPVDVKETFPFLQTFDPAPAVGTSLFVTFGVSRPNRILIVRQVHWASEGPNAPQSVQISKNNGTRPLIDDRSPAPDGVIAGGRDSAPVIAALWPLVLYPGEDLGFNFFRSPPVSLEFTLTVTGEEFELPFRSVAT